MSRVQFGIAQFVGISVAEALIPSHALNAERRTLLVAGVTLAFGFLALIAVKRLQNIGWRRQWALLVVAPATLQVLIGLRGENAAKVGLLGVSVVAILCTVTVAYVVMTIILVLKAGQPSSHGSSSPQPAS